MAETHVNAFLVLTKLNEHQKTGLGFDVRNLPS
jgi:hypothetical protein